MREQLGHPRRVGPVLDGEHVAGVDHGGAAAATPARWRRAIFTQAYDRRELDAALLLLPTVGFVDWRDERMIRTTHAVREELGAGDGLLYRYRRDDGLDGDEGAFLCCSFWLVECLAQQGDDDGAREVFDATLGRANDLGLFSEEFDPQAGELLGNFPQGLTHLAHIDAAVCLAETHPHV